MSEYYYANTKISLYIYRVCYCVRHDFGLKWVSTSPANNATLLGQMRSSGDPTYIEYT